MASGTWHVATETVEVERVTVADEDKLYKHDIK